MSIALLMEPQELTLLLLLPLLLPLLLLLSNPHHLV
jgi:hypothetical protein